jgi:hypothetical protein
LIVANKGNSGESEVEREKGKERQDETRGEISSHVQEKLIEQDKVFFYSHSKTDERTEMEWGKE